MEVTSHIGRPATIFGLLGTKLRPYTTRAYAKTQHYQGVDGILPTASTIPSPGIRTRGGSPERTLAPCANIPPMPRSSNRSPRGAHSNRTHARRDQALEQHQRSNPPAVEPNAAGNPMGPRTLSDFGQPTRRIQQELNRMEAASVIGRDSPRSGAPPGVGGGGASPGSGRHATSRLPGEKPRTGDTVPSANGRYSVTLTGRDGGKALRCTGKLSRSEGRKLVASLAQGPLTTGRKVIYKAAGSTEQVLPAASVDRSRAVYRWINSTIGRAAGIRAVRSSLREYGLWSRVEAVAKRHDSKEKRKDRK